MRLEPRGSLLSRASLAPSASIGSGRVRSMLSITRNQPLLVPVPRDSKALDLFAPDADITAQDILLVTPKAKQLALVVEHQVSRDGRIHVPLEPFPGRPRLCRGAIGDSVRSSLNCRGPLAARVLWCWRG